jgi:hypothetical protein
MSKSFVHLRQQWMGTLVLFLVSTGGTADAADSGTLQDSGSSLAKKATYQCNDGIDNDGDGFADYPHDPQCFARYDFSELPQCSDGLDNDGNGVVDYPADEDGCLSPEDDSEVDLPPIGLCSNGLDEDLDGLIDYPSDPDCISEFDLTENKAKKKGQDPFCGVILPPRECGRDPGQE